MKLWPFKLRHNDTRHATKMASVEENGVPYADRIKLKFEAIWKARDNEIEAIKERSLLVWGFLMFCYGGYGILVRDLLNESPISDNRFRAFNLALFFLALVCFRLSAYWTKMMKGAKAWAENYDFIAEEFQHKYFRLSDKATSCPYALKRRHGTTEAELNAMFHRKDCKNCRQDPSHACVFSVADPRTLYFPDVDRCILTDKSGAFSPPAITIAIARFSMFIDLILAFIHGSAWLKGKTDSVAFLTDWRLRLAVGGLLLVWFVSPFLRRTMECLVRDKDRNNRRFWRCLPTIISGQNSMGLVDIGIIRSYCQNRLKRWKNRMNKQKTRNVGACSITTFVLSFYLALTSFAATETVNGVTWTYSVSNGEASIGTGIQYSSAVSPSDYDWLQIPSSLGGYPVTSIGTYAFNCCSVTYVTIPDSVKIIGDRAFFACRYLTSITIPDSVTNVGDYAFYGCSKLETVTIGNSVTSIGEHAFYDCSELWKVYISDAATWCGIQFADSYSNPCIPADCVLNAHGGFIQNLVISNNMTSINDMAFAYWRDLESVTIPDSVTSIGHSAFSHCSGLTSITIPDGVTSIGDSAFYECYKLTSVTIPDGVTSIGDGVFSGCSKLTSVAIPDSVTSIGNRAFNSCSSLTSITIPDGVTSIGDRAFEWCSGLTSIMIPDSVTNIGDYAFYNCSNLIKLYLPETYSGYTSWGLSDNTVLIRYVAVSFDPTQGAFAHNASFILGEIGHKYGETFEFPTPVRSGYSFDGWRLYGSSITENSIVQTRTNHVLTAAWTPNGYTVSFDATGGAVDPASKGVTFDAVYGALPTPMRDPYVFVDWRLSGAMVDAATVVTTPSNHVLSAHWGISIGNGIWEETICDEPISLGAPLVAPSGDVVVPAEIDGRPVVEIGAEAFAGNAAVASITIPASVTNVADGAFAGCTGLKTVAIDSLRGDRFAAFLPDLAETVERVVFLDGVTAIPDDFFEDCTTLRTMDLAESVVDIGTNVFEACSALETVVSNGLEICDGWVLGMANGAAAPADLAIPEGVRGIAANAFEGEWGIGTLAMPESLRFVGARAFKDCTSLEGIAVPEGVAKIDREAFRNCTYAQGLALPGTLREIGDGAFANASMLMGATLPDGVVSVGACAFSNCWRMLSVAIPQSVERVGDGAFADCRRVAGVTVPLHVRPVSELFPAAYSNLATVAVASLVEGSEGLAVEGSWESFVASRQMVPEVFKGCAALEGIELPAWVSNVSDGAFAGCASISSLAFPDAVTNVGARACASMAALGSVALPVGLVSIGDEALDGDAGIAALRLPEGLRTIGERAFRGLALLARAEIPGSVRTIGDGAFAGCAAIRAVSMPGDAGTVAAVFPDCHADIISATVVAEDGAAAGGGGPPVAMAGLFAGCSALTYVELPAELAEIGAEAFADCTSLAEIGIPAAVTNLGERAFAGCGTLSSVALPKSLEELRDGTFAGCASIAEIVVPESVRRFGNGIFSGCTLLRSVRFVGNAPDYVAAEGGPYAGVPAGAKSYVANGSKGWDGIATSMALPEYWPSGTTYEIAFWTPNRFDAAFDPNHGGEVAVEVEQVTGTSYVLPPDPVRLGARFAGWWTAPENGARVTASMQVTATRPLTFYAHWTMNRYWVYFDANGGSGTAEPVEMTVGTPAALPPCPFAKIGNSFAGWATEPGGAVVYADGAAVADLAYAQNAAVTLYAVWQAREWTLTDYLDAPGLAFETAGGSEWGPDWDDAKAGGVSLRCDGLPPAAAGGRTNATLRAAVTGAGTLVFWWKVDCEPEDEAYDEWFDYATFAVDGTERARIAGESGWRRVECVVVGAGAHELLWTFTRDDYDEDGADWENELWVDGVEWTPAAVTVAFDAGGAAEGEAPVAVVKWEGYTLVLPGPGTLVDPPRSFAGWSDGETVHLPGETFVFGSTDVVLTAVWTLQTWTLAEAVDAPALVFATGGDADWAIDTASGWTNGVSAKSGAVASGEESWTEAEVSGAGTLIFRWKVLGGIYRGNPFAYAKIEVDGTNVVQTFLTDGWEERTVEVSGAGTHTIRWTYLRTSARDCDGDCAWLDGVAWTPAGAANVVVEGVEIPFAWIATNAPAALAAAGGDYEAAAKSDAANGENKVWECYVAGLDPTNATERFLAIVNTTNGMIAVNWTPDLNESGTKNLRVYTVEGKTNLVDRSWGPTNEATRYFRVKVSMPEE